MAVLEMSYQSDIEMGVSMYSGATKTLLINVLLAMKQQPKGAGEAFSSCGLHVWRWQDGGSSARELSFQGLVYFCLKLFLPLNLKPEDSPLSPSFVALCLSVFFAYGK